MDNRSVPSCRLWVHASRVYPTCAHSRADLGQARDRCLAALARDAKLAPNFARRARPEHFWRNEPTLRKRNSSATKETSGTTMFEIVRVHAARRESLRMAQAAFCNELLDQACAFR